MNNDYKAHLHAVAPPAHRSTVPQNCIPCELDTPSSTAARAIDIGQGHHSPACRRLLDCRSGPQPVRVLEKDCLPFGLAVAKLSVAQREKRRSPQRKDACPYVCPYYCCAYAPGTDSWNGVGFLRSLPLDKPPGPVHNGHGESVPHVNSLPTGNAKVIRFAMLVFNAHARLVNLFHLTWTNINSERPSATWYSSPSSRSRRAWASPLRRLVRTRSSARQRRGFPPEDDFRPSPLQRAFTHVGNIFRDAHAQDFERRKKPELGRDPRDDKLAGAEESSDESDNEDGAGDAVDGGDESEKSEDEGEDEVEESAVARIREDLAVGFGVAGEGSSGR
ncbi:hypothetical protein OPT61_g7229 [Boeremia exigua]|uniref:Uncharacterized protein n=1 Tax=Boeremia exigua TaxID=749465 RepID=A0ACC2I3G7_9PLEO|nr:hypothetical protein OPT61_g7229 [Boeremia exigua]